MPRLVPWWLLHLIDRLCPWTCWTGLVMWKLGYGWSWRQNEDCNEPAWGGTRCYCGKRRCHA